MCKIISEVSYRVKYLLRGRKKVLVPLYRISFVLDTSQILAAVIYGKLPQHVSSPSGYLSHLSGGSGEWALFKERWSELSSADFPSYGDTYSRGKVERQMPWYSRECTRTILWKIKIRPAGVFTARTSRTCGADKHRSVREYILLLQYFERAFMKMDPFTFYNFAPFHL